MQINQETDAYYAWVEDMDQYDRFCPVKQLGFDNKGVPFLATILKQEKKNEVG